MESPEIAPRWRLRFDGCNVSAVYRAPDGSAQCFSGEASKHPDLKDEHFYHTGFDAMQDLLDLKALVENMIDHQEAEDAREAERSA